MNILIVGGGKMGMSHLALMSQYIGKPNVALCDTSLVNRCLFRSIGYKTFSSLNSAFKELPDLSGVIIATPTSAHFSVAKWALNRKLSCFIEKPLTLNPKLSEELLALAKKNNIYVQLGFVMRYLKSFQRLRNLVLSNCLGNVLHYKIVMCGNVITKALKSNNWKGDYSRGGGSLNEYGPHVIDICNFLFGEIKSVENIKVNKIYSINADDEIIFDTLHDHFIRGNVAINWCDSSRRKSIIEANVQFEKGSVHVDNSSIKLDGTLDNHTIDNKKEFLDFMIPDNVKYYLRGEEYSLEIEDFLRFCDGGFATLDKSSIDFVAPGLNEGCVVDKLICDIAKQGGLK